MFGKLFHTPLGGKGFHSTLLGAGKGLARVLDEPLVQGAISAAIPEVAPAYEAVKKSGLLEKFKN